MAPRSRQHLARLGRIVRHARLTQHVQPCVERGERDRAVHVRPRADQHGVETAGREQLFPVRVGIRECRARRRRGGSTRASGSRRRRSRRPVAAQARHVHGAHDAAGADDADADPASPAAADGAPACAHTLRGASAAATGSAADDRNSRRLKRRPEIGLVAHVFLSRSIAWPHTIPPSLELCRARAEAVRLERNGGGTRMNERRLRSRGRGRRGRARRGRAGPELRRRTRAAVDAQDARRAAGSAGHVGQLRQHAVRNGHHGAARHCSATAVNPPAHWADHDSPDEPERAARWSSIRRTAACPS